MSLLPVDEATARILSRLRPLPPERVSLLEARGRVLAEAVLATRRLPAWDNSAMDGYAVRAADLATPGVTLPVVGEVAAGAAGDVPLAPGTTVRIFTGAPVPPGADAVVMQEDTSREGGGVTFKTAPRVGENVRRAGSDVEPGTVVLPAGRALTPGDLALLAALGRLSANVHRRPEVAILSSGSELVDVDGDPPGPGQIVNSNAWALAAAVLDAGGVPRVLPILRDDREATIAALADAAATADVLLTSGGVSVGDHDHVGPALSALSGDALAFWKVAIRPGKPLIFGLIQRCAAFGLPGNPISALVTFEVFVRPALRRLLGHTDPLRRPVPAVTRTPLGATGTRREYLRAAVEVGPDGRLTVDPGRTQGSGNLSSLVGADALVVRREGSPAIEAGAAVEVLLLTEVGARPG